MMIGTTVRRSFAGRALALAVVALAAGACASAAPAPAPVATAPPAAPVPPPPPVAVGRVAEVLPEAFESDEWVVTFAKAGDTAETLAARYLGDAGKAWMIEDYTGARRFTDGQEVVIPKRPWNPAGIQPGGYHLVPILVYHNLAPQAKGRMVLATSAFQQQMRYLKAEGYRVISLRDFVEAMNHRRQLPGRSVVLTFDDGYRSFREHAYPVLKELGFTATLFVYLDYVGAGRNALSWKDLRELAAEGFDVQAHSKTHSDLRRTQGETDAQYAQRLQAELAGPLPRFQRELGHPATALAYPYGATDDDVMQRARQAGYVAGFTVRRQANPTFVSPLRINRSQIYSEMTLEDFARNLNVFHREELK